MRGILGRSAVAGSLLLLLAGCGGGGGLSIGGDDSGGDVSDVRWPVNPVTVRSLTGGELPDFTSEDIDRSVDRLTGDANSLLSSDFLLFATYGPPIRGESFCSGDECTTSVVGSTLRLFLSDGIGIRGPSEYQAVSNHRGVLLAQGRGKGDIVGTPADYTGYGGWLDHSFFVSEFNRFNDELLKNTPFNYSYSIGDATGSNPTAESGSGVWTGVMVGADVGATAARNSKIQGDAKITIADFDDPVASIAFTNIHDLDARGRRPDMIWSAIPVTAGGFERAGEGAVKNVIRGKFYGPNHEEVGGIFERDQILGAFGAARQQP